MDYLFKPKLESPPRGLEKKPKNPSLIFGRQEQGSKEEKVFFLPFIIFLLRKNKKLQKDGGRGHELV